jgi:putative transposase
LVTKYRRGVLTGEHTCHLNGIFAKVCSDFAVVLAKSNGKDEHVHLLAEYPPRISAAALVNSLTGVPARMLRQRYRIRTHRDHL